MLRALSSLVPRFLSITSPALCCRQFVSLVASPTPAKLPNMVSTSLLIKREWAYPPFGRTPPPLCLPVYDLKTGMFSGNNLLVLPEKIFNVPVRRDLIHNVFRYERHSKFRRFKRTKTVGDVAGSGKKPRPQKHSGRARQGNKRAPINYHGGKAFGSVPKDFEFPLNKKVRLLAMKSLLSSRLMENRIVVVEDFKMESHKTKDLAKMIRVFSDAKILMLTQKEMDDNFEKASRNLPQVTVAPAIVTVLAQK